MRGEKIIQAVLACAKVASKEIDEFGLEIWVESLDALNDIEFARAMGYMRQAFREQRMPRIVDVEGHAKQKLNAQDEAQRCVDLICTAISTCGYTNPERAKAYIGELGWQLVQELGGWASICSIESYKELEYAKINWRKSAEILHKRAAMGAIDYKPELPKPQDIAPGLQFENNQLRLVR